MRELDKLKELAREKETDKGRSYWNERLRNVVKAR